LQIFVKRISARSLLLYVNAKFYRGLPYGILYILDGVKAGSVDSESYFRGRSEFNQGAFFHAHEAFEEAWRTAPGDERKFLQAMVQLAVAFHHFHRGNLAGAASVMKRAGHNLAAYPEQFGGLDLMALRRSIGDWQQAMADGSPAPSLPKL
jgi:uncharacterized protein